MTSPLWTFSRFQRSLRITLVAWAVLIVLYYAFVLDWVFRYNTTGEDVRWAFEGHHHSFTGFRRLSGDWKIGRDGKLVVPTDEDGGLTVHGKRHPIYDLVAQAERKWNWMLKRQSKTLSQAVKEYKRRYHRMPPKGFDKWYEWAIQNEVILLDEYDQIDHDISPYLAMPPDVIRLRIQELEGLKHSFHIDIRDGHLTSYGDKNKSAHAREYRALLSDFAHLLPDLTVRVSAHDAGSQILSEELRTYVAQLRQTRDLLTMENITYFEAKERNPKYRILNACNDSPAVEASKQNATRNVENSVTFVDDHRMTMNFCRNPTIVGLDPMKTNGGRGAALSPYFVISKLDQGGELLLPAVTGYEDVDISKVIPWSERKVAKAFWRGRSTGFFFVKGNHHRWHEATRVALHRLANAKTGDFSLLVEESEMEEMKTMVYSKAVLNEAYLDVGLVAPAVQCDMKDGSCGKLAEELNLYPRVDGNAGNTHKFALDVDGNAWSQRYRRLLSTGSVVLKETVFPEWNSDWLIPWYHYIPVQPDFSDLYNIMSFFVGEPDGVGGHDDMAERISNRAIKFVEKYWRWEDLQAYAFRLLLEYARVSAPDREKMTYTPPTAKD